MFVLKASNKNIIGLKRILRCFHFESGQKVNYQKTKVIRIRVNQSYHNRFVAVLKCNIMALSFPYLGVNIGGNHRRKEFWEGMVTKIKKRLAK